MPKRFEEYSEQERQKALENIQRKSQGKRISFWVGGQYSEGSQRAYEQYLAENPQARQQVETGQQARLEAQRRGFDSVKEMQQVEGFQYSSANRPAQVVKVERGYPTKKEQVVMYDTITTIEKKEDYQREPTREEKRQEYLSQSWVARTKSGGVSTFGTIGRAFGKGVAYIDPYVEKAFGSRVVSEPVRTIAFAEVPAYKVEQIAGDVSKWVFFSPAMTTTAQYKIQVARTEKVDFGGVSQQTEEGYIKTRIKYETTSGKKGVAEGISQIKQGQAGYEDYYFSATKVKGATYKEAYKFPTTEKIKVSKEFYKGEQFALTKQQSPYTFEQVGYGKVVTKKGTEKFVSMAQGIETKKVVLSQGVTLRERGSTLFEGFVFKLKGVAKPSTQTITNVQPSGLQYFTLPPQQTAQQISIQQATASTSIKQIVSASIVPKTTTYPVGTIAGSTLTSARQIQISSPRSAVSYQPTTQVTSVKQIQTPTTRTFQTPKYKEISISSSISAVIPSQPQTQVPKAIVTPITIPKSSVISKTPKATIPSIKTKPTSPILTPPPFILGADFGKIGIGRISTKPKYSYTPSYGAFAFGITGKKKAPSFGGRYSGFELRPITSDWLKGFSITPKRRKRKNAKSRIRI